MKAKTLQLMLVLVICVAAPGAAVAGTCKLSIVIDHSGSMTAQRTDGSGKTRCYVAALGAKDALTAYYQGDEYMVNTGRIARPDDDYDLNCPDRQNRLASVWVFTSQVSSGEPTMYHITASPAHPDGFVPAMDAITALKSSGLVLFDNGQGIVPKDQCQGWTPLSQTMCRSARDFAAGSPPSGEIRKAIILTDGEENWSDVVTIDPGESRCRLPGEPTTPDPNSGWGARVIAEYVSRGIAATGFLFGNQVLTIAAAGEKAGATYDPLLSDRAGATGRATGMLTAAASGEWSLYFSNLASRTGGHYVYAEDDLVLDPTHDTDGDGIPDYRDFCPFSTCAGNDLDHDGIPDAQDDCPLDREDGNGAYPADGCPDSDGDSVQDLDDKCPTAYEDHLPPKPNDGCPASIAAVPALSIPFGVILGLGLGGLGLTRVRRRRGDSARRAS